MQRLSDSVKKKGVCLLAKGKGGNKVKMCQEKTQIVAEMSSYFKINSEINSPDGNLSLECSSILLP